MTCSSTGSLNTSIQELSLRSNRLTGSLPYQLGKDNRFLLLNDPLHFRKLEVSYLARHKLQFVQRPRALVSLFNRQQPQRFRVHLRCRRREFERGLRSHRRRALVPVPELPHSPHREPLGVLRWKYDFEAHFPSLFNQLIPELHHVLAC